MASSNQIVDFMPTEIADGLVINMQTMYMSWLTMFIVAALLLVVSRNPKLVPGKMQLLVEAIFEGLGNIVSDTLGKRGQRILGPLFITLFMYIFVGNEVGLLPQIFEPLHFHFTSPTADLNTTLALALFVVVVVQFVGVFNKGLGYFSHFIQPNFVMLPINLVDELAKPITLSFRLFGNIIAGEILMVILYKLIPLFLPSIWLAFSLFVGLVQASIFSILSICYMRSAFSEDH